MKNDMGDRRMASPRIVSNNLTALGFAPAPFLVAGKNGHPRAMRAPGTYPVSHLKGGFDKPIFLPHFHC